MTFSKGHDPAQRKATLAEPNRQRRQELMNALKLKGTRRLVSPQAALINHYPVFVPESPANNSARTAAELAQLGLMQLLIDVPLAEINTHPIAIRGAKMLADFGIPRMLYGEGAAGLFHMNEQRTGEGRVGRLVKIGIPTGWGNSFYYEAGRRKGFYGNTKETWQALQDGTVPVPQQFGSAEFSVTPRDIASLAHQDPPGFIGRCVILQLFAAKAPRSSRLPATPAEDPFVTPGGAWELPCAQGIAMLEAGEHGWMLKERWSRPRPEELWPLAARGELHESFLRLAGWIVKLLGPYLPMPIAEGCPLHSSSPSGHAIDAGVWVTLCKANFADGPVPSLGITSLHPELDLLAWHMTVGRSWLGIHYRQDLTAGLRIGEHYALQYLREQNARSPQPLNPTSFIGVDGKLIVLEGN